MLTKNILRRQEYRTGLLMAVIAAVTVLMLFLQSAGFLSLSLRSSAVYNPLPSYGPLRQDYGATESRRAASSSSTQTTIWYRPSASSGLSSSTTRSQSSLDQSRAARRQRILERQRQRSSSW